MRNRQLGTVLLAALLAATLTGCVAETAPPLASPPGGAEQPPPAPPAAQQSPPVEEEQPSAAETPEPDDDRQTADAVRTPEVVGGTVLRVVDGDTAHISVKGQREKVRFIGIDTPESTREIEPFGKEASAYTKRLLPEGRRVWLQTDAELRDRYGRLLAYVWLEKPDSDSDAEMRKKMLNARIALDGYAQQMTIPPNVSYADRFGAYVREAREAGRGLWSLDPSADDPDAASVAGIGSAGTPSSADVYVTRTGEKYHLAGCSSLSRSKIEVTLADALDRGFEPCKRCDPPR